MKIKKLIPSMLLITAAATLCSFELFAVIKHRTEGSEEASTQSFLEETHDLSKEDLDELYKSKIKFIAIKRLDLIKKGKNTEENDKEAIDLYIEMAKDGYSIKKIDLLRSRALSIVTNLIMEEYKHRQASTPVTSR